MCGTPPLHRSRVETTDRGQGSVCGGPETVTSPLKVTTAPCDEAGLVVTPLPPSRPPRPGSCQAGWCGGKQDAYYADGRLGPAVDVNCCGGRACVYHGKDRVNEEHIVSGVENEKGEGRKKEGRKEGRKRNDE